jgi:hypothetical protein
VGRMFPHSDGEICTFNKSVETSNASCELASSQQPCSRYARSFCAGLALMQ